ncbi:kinesin-like protein KIN-14N isoform X1 [Beta vulgaris subsp. vulgaris]|uniref:kinesin-like protein KIN-14N isoform X1 n=1 Tax=Beta vulgaris subsp. vulgaris TaxID=3555 RepID=UPI002036AF1F|nr:kinesin-like protein KIN-14N isoform X1 [Beta vulgaris subsp. vulgaris]XP_010694267.2 kinesin-like protein KIN-14N isoform X1 [Beta vulgaris subsp. vulgaris]
MMMMKYQNQFNGVEGLEQRRRESMVGPRSNGIRSFSGANGRRESFPASAPPSAPGSNAGSDVGVLEFAKEDVELLLNERMRTKNKFNYKERCEQMMDYIRRLRLCIRWFQELEGGYLLEQDNLRELLQAAERKCSDMEMLMQNKEEELNAIIMELRKNYNLLQDKCAKEESDKLVVMDDLSREKEARIAAERLQTSLSEDLEKARQEQQTSSQKISSLNDMYKRLQDYNTSLQQYNSKLQTELSTANETLKRVESEKAAVAENLSTLRGQYTSLQDQLTLSKSSQEEAVKQKEALINEVGCLRTELQQARDDRDRQLSQVQTLADEIAKYKDFTGRSVSELDCLTVKSNELEQAKCSTQNELVQTLQNQLAAAHKKLQMSDLSATETRMQFEEQNMVICDLRNRLADAEVKLVEGEKLRKKLHNTILELKGNIRVFCRVRPILPDESSTADTKVIAFPTSTETMGRGVDLLQNGQKHSFTFDKVFTPDAPQQDVFVEISQLVQSALDGYKVCIFAYGQTGSGKTYTMMGSPGNPEKKGLIPRSLEQIFATRQSLKSQGWKYELQVSMLEIYNETIRDLLSTSKSSSIENGTAGKHYTIKHDANGNTHVSDLTVVDVRSSKEVAYLLEKAAISRSVGKTLMNEQSSRSHFVFTMRISGVNESTEQQVQGVLNLIDLAGSERLSKSGSTGDRLKETQAINKSLSSLSDVIFALAKREDHVPFRNSKLTYLLQPCLGGDSKTLMFANISPESSSLSESLCSLRFAARVNACEIGIPRRQTNVRSSESRLSYG